MFYAILKSISQNNSKVIVELKNDMELKGNLVSVDTNLNIVLSKPNFEENDKMHQFKYTYNTFIRGNVIRYIHFDKKDIISIYQMKKNEYRINRRCLQKII